MTTWNEIIDLKLEKRKALKEEREKEKAKKKRKENWGCFATVIILLVVIYLVTNFL